MINMISMKRVNQKVIIKRIIGNNIYNKQQLGKLKVKDLKDTILMMKTLISGKSSNFKII